MAPITEMLARPGLEEEVFSALNAELRELAAACLRNERPDHTLQPTALVNEAYLRLVKGQPISWESRAHFFGVAARAMRQILVDHARRRNRGKRQGERVRLELDDKLGFVQLEPEIIIALDEALERLRHIDERCVKAVELMFFAGLNQQETASILGVSDKTVQRDWEFARVWLERQLRPL